MSHGLQLTVFFAISVALHGVGLWAAAGRFEPRAPEPAAEVAIVDRDLFFRHAERSEIQALPSLLEPERLGPEATVLGKPFDIDTLGQALRSALRRPLRTPHSGEKPTRVLLVDDNMDVAAILAEEGIVLSRAERKRLFDMPRSSWQGFSSSPVAGWRLEA